MLSNRPLHLLIFLLFFPFWSSAKSPNGGFRVELVRRDSPLSPFYNPSATPLDRFTGATRRSLIRSRSYLSSDASTSSIQSIVIPDSADHLMKFSIGTPPVQVFAVMDTGSDLFWSRCEPCTDCIGRMVPLFNPQRSSTYKELPCGSPHCKALNPSACNEGPKCSYGYGYADGSYTNGVLSSETLTFDSTDGRTISIHNVTFGCGHNNSNSLTDHFAGLAGLGRQSYSLMSQLSPHIGGKFSYCFAPFQENSPSIMSFGNEAMITGPDVVSTPLLSGEAETPYYVALEYISVGDTRLKYPPPKASGTGNMFIDSGTTVTFLDPNVFSQLKEALTRAVNLPPTTDPGKTFLCYHATSRDKFPTITFHFAGGADVVLHPLNTFTEPSPEGLVCLSMLPQGGYAVFGNTVQHNFHISYDLVGKTVSFKPTQCSKGLK